MGVYRLEISKGSRAGCRSKECLDNAVKIQKGELRFGTQVEIQEKQAWHWRHWGCVTPRQLTNWNETTEGNVDYLDGYDEITPELQEKVKRALEQGHVDDEDWKGDVEFNRPGMNGMRKRTPKKKPTEESADNNDIEQSPSKPATKKRARGKKATEEEEEEVNEAPAPKKKRAGAGRSKKEQFIEESANSENEVPVTEKRGEKTEAIEDQAVSQDEKDEVVVSKKKAKGASKKQAMNKAKEATEENPATHETRKVKGTDAVAKKPRAPKKGSNATEPKSETSDVESEEDIQDSPKTRKGRNKHRKGSKTRALHTTTKSRAKKSGAEAV
ncbi:hypothetical protein MMC16_000068 [Acarospora aff. strigata]|nr:hypothetical protein [Acarospora aff. strigata]